MNVYEILEFGLLSWRGGIVMRSFMKLGEKGAIIVFFAFLFPFMMICLGLAFDLGNLYVHKSRLQNAADAAALAGAREFAVKEETVDSHPNADIEAGIYADNNAHENNIPNDITKEYQAKPNSENTAIYYRVKLSETVPVYFLRLIDIYEQEVVASSVAAILMSAGDGGEDVFIFSDKFSLVNSISNPDNYDVDGQIKTTFNASISYTSRTNPLDKDYRYRYLGYSSQTDEDSDRRLGTFFTDNAKGMSVNAARNKDGVTQEQINNGKSIDYSESGYVHTAHYISYDMDEILRQTTSQLNIGMSLPQKPEDNVGWLAWNATEEETAAYNARKAEYDSAMEEYNNEMKKYSTTKDTYYSSDLVNEGIAIAPGANYARTINIDGSLGSEDDKPLYVYIDENCSPVHINVTASNNRPVVLCYAGTSQLDFNMSEDVTFRGILYMPNSPEEMSLLIHDSPTSKFEGSIIANSLTMHGSGASYKFVNFGVTADGYMGDSNKNKTKVGPSSTVKLISDSDIEWD